MARRDNTKYYVLGGAVLLGSGLFVLTAGGTAAVYLLTRPKKTDGEGSAAGWGVTKQSQVGLPGVYPKTRNIGELDVSKSVGWGISGGSSGSKGWYADKQAEAAKSAKAAKAAKGITSALGTGIGAIAGGPLGAGIGGTIAGAIGGIFDAIF